MSTTNTNNRRRVLPLALTSGCLLLSGRTNAFTLPNNAAIPTSRSRTSCTTSSRLHMSGFPQTEEDIAVLRHGKKRAAAAELSAVAIATYDYDENLDGVLVLDENSHNSIDENPSSILQDSNTQDSLRDWMIPVLSTSFLITANTVGASCLVLPELAAGPGLPLFGTVSLVTYVINLISGLIMAEVAIQQYEASGEQGSSSFKDFADASFQSPLFSNAIAGVSILTNAAVLAFTFSKAGEVGSQVLGGMLDPTTVSLGFCGLVGVGMSSLTREALSGVASVCVAGLFLSFAGLLLPGLAAVQDPLAVWTAPGLSDVPLASAAQAFPILLLSLVYQNIVPSVAKILNYDRTKTTASLALGSFIPLAMYMAWCYVGMGGGIGAAADGGVSALAVTGFSMATICGSSVGTTMSVAEEFDAFMASSDNDSDDNKDVFSVPAVAAAIAVPMLAIHACGEGFDMTAALGLAGSMGTPLLYGLVPALMAYKQLERQDSTVSQRGGQVVPGGMTSLAALALASTGMVGQSLVEQVSAMMTVAA